MDISPAEANVVVWEKGTRVKGKLKVVIDEDLIITDDWMGNDDVSSSTNNQKGKAKAVDKPKFITPTLPDPTDKAKSKWPAPNDDSTSK